VSETTPPAAEMAKSVWSVMVPVHNRTAHLRQCLESVLAASIPRERMQIAVVDDSTANPNVEAEVRAIAGARVEFHRNEQNLGMAGNWNRCIAVARGALVHILHDDDYVSPGFYPGMEALAAKFPQASIYFSRVLQVDDGGSINWVSPRLKSFEDRNSYLNFWLPGNSADYDIGYFSSSLKCFHNIGSVTHQPHCSIGIMSITIL
jgi:GT2 family glycosyltransferase